MEFRSAEKSVIGRPGRARVVTERNRTKIPLIWVEHRADSEPFVLHGPSFGGFALAGERHRHFCAGSLPAPDGVGLLLLKHHVVADDRRELEFRAERWRKAEHEREREE